MPRLYRRICVPLLVAAMITGAGCSRRHQPDERTTARSGEAPVAGGVAVIAVPSEPDVMNSLIRTSAVAGHILSLLQAGLVEMGEDLQWQPMIASSWELAADSLAITYHLRPWAWSDGQPLTAQDVVSTFALLIDPRVGSPRAGQYSDVARAVAVDSATVRYEFRRPVVEPVARTFHAILPWHVTRELDPADIAHWPLNQRPLASGPFALQSWDHNRQLTLVPNPEFPLARPWLDRVIFVVMPDENARVLALETGEVDFVADLTAGAAARLAGAPHVRVEQVPSRAVVYVLWNLRRPALADVRVRRALSLAIDRPRIVHDILRGRGQAAASFLPPPMWNHDGSLTPDPYDPAQARHLLAAAGWSDHDGDGWVDDGQHALRFTLLVQGGDPMREETSALVRAELRDVGVDAQPRRLELAALVAALRAGDFDAALVEFKTNLYGDPSELVRSDAQGQFNFGGYADAQVDSLLDAALREADRDRARPLWNRLQSRLAADPPAALLYYPAALVGVNTRLQDVRPHMLSPYNNLPQWWIAPGDRRRR